jgi:hypothetical protein
MGRAGEPWSLCFCDVWFEAGSGPLSLWLLRDTSEECLAVVSRWPRRANSDLAAQIKSFGHAGTTVFLNERQYRAMVDACKRDPRTGGEKRQALQQERQ